MARGTIVTRTTADGAKRYSAVMRVNGRQRWKTFLRKKEAEDFLDRHSTDVRDGTYRELTKATFAEYVTHWKGAHLIAQSFKPSTLNGYRCNVEKHITPAFSSFPIAGISAADINRFRADLLKGGLSRKSVRNILTLLGKILADALADGYLRHSPMIGVKKPAVTRDKKGRALRPEEIKALLAACDAETRLVVMTAALTGMRRAEVFGLRWDDLDWEANIIKVRRSLFWRHGKYQDKRAEGEPAWIFVSPKSRASMREIDLSPALRKELRERFLKSERKGLVFRSESGAPVDPDWFLRRRFKPAVARAELGRVRLHDLRHTYGALKIEQGENVYYVQRQMGHSSIQVTVDVYGHLLETRKPEAAAKTDRLVFGL